MAAGTHSNVSEGGGPGQVLAAPEPPDRVPQPTTSSARLRAVCPHDDSCSWGPDHLHMPSTAIPLYMHSSRLFGNASPRVHETRHDVPVAYSTYIRLYVQSACVRAFTVACQQLLCDESMSCTVSCGIGNNETWRTADRIAARTRHELHPTSHQLSRLQQHRQSLNGAGRPANTASTSSTSRSTSHDQRSNISNSSLSSFPQACARYGIKRGAPSAPTCRRRRAFVSYKAPKPVASHAASHRIASNQALHEGSRQLIHHRMKKRREMLFRLTQSWAAARRGRRAPVVPLSSRRLVAQRHLLLASGCGYHHQVSCGLGLPGLAR